MLGEARVLPETPDRVDGVALVDNMNFFWGVGEPKLGGGPIPCWGLDLVEGLIETVRVVERKAEALFYLWEQ